MVYKGALSAMQSKTGEVSAEDLELFVTSLLSDHAYDFTRYAPSSLKRRLRRIMELDGHPDVPSVLTRLAGEKTYLPRVVAELTVNVTEMFRDPHFFLTLRQKVLPVLATYPFIRIWHAGCASGEEALSLAIILKEEGLLDKCLLYATDISTTALQRARRGAVNLSLMRDYTRAYQAAGGVQDFSSYYTVQGREAVFKEDLRKRIVFAVHNLVSDASFNAFQLILCRNVLIYFNKDLQDRILDLFDDSLEPLGFLALGSKESLAFSSLADRYTQKGEEKIWRRKY